MSYYGKTRFWKTRPVILQWKITIVIQKWLCESVEFYQGIARLHRVAVGRATHTRDNNTNHRLFIKTHLKYEFQHFFKERLRTWILFCCKFASRLTHFRNYRFEMFFGFWSFEDFLRFGDVADFDKNPFWCHCLVFAVLVCGRFVFRKIHSWICRPGFGKHSTFWDLLS